MTPREHLLILALLTRQAHSSKILADILKSRDIMTHEDWRAFEYAASEDARANSSLFELMKGQYIGMAAELGIQTGLEHIPPTPIPSGS
jgi:hypothetical protein